MKVLIFVFIIFTTFVCLAQNLEINGSGIATLNQSTPDGNWLVVKEGNQYKIYQEDFEEIDSFSLANYDSYYTTIYGASRDFDEDENIEILFQIMEENTYYNSVYLLDISTNTIQIEYIGNSSYDYYCFGNGYLGNERVFAISRRNRNTNEYDASYVYRSGIEVSFSDQSIPKPMFQLNPSYPNPFYANSNRKSFCNIQFSLKEKGSVSLSVFNMNGQTVKTLLENENLSSGDHVLQWNATDKNGRKVASGNYLYELKMNNETQIRKTIIIQ